MKALKTTVAALLACCIQLTSVSAHADCGTAAPTPHCGATPSLQFDRTGTLWAVFAEDERVWLSHSADLGKQWTPAVPVNAEPEPIYADGENRPVLALGNDGEVFVAWTRRNDGPYQGDIRFTRSLDGGASFMPVRTANDDGLATSHRFVSMTRSADGLLYLAWLDKRDQVRALAHGADYTGAALYYTVSRDAGASFAPNRKVADNSCECCRVALAPRGKNGIVAFWRHVFDGGTVRDHALATLGMDGTVGFARATEDDWRLDGCPHHGPALAAESGALHLVWFTNGTKQQGLVYGYRAGPDAPTTRVTVLDAQPAGGHPVIHAQGSKIVVLWVSYDGTAMRLMRADSTDGGSHWQSAREVLRTSGASDYPFVVRHGAAAWFGWQTQDEGLRLLPLP